MAKRNAKVQQLNSMHGKAGPSSTPVWGERLCVCFLAFVAHNGLHVVTRNLCCDCNTHQACFSYDMLLPVPALVTPLSGHHS